MRTLTSSLLVAALCLSGCPDDNPAGPDAGAPGPDGGTAAIPDGGFDPGPPPAFATSTRNQLVWKRHRTFEQDLLGALSLDKGELCNELGRYSCADFVHLVPLGGNDPFDKAQYEPLTEPSVTTSLSVDRVVLAGCGRRVALDAVGPAVVFGALDLQAASLDVSDPAVDAAVAEVITALYRRFLARDPSYDEAALVRELLIDDAGQPVSARDFARLACYVVGTTTETLFQ